MPLAIDLAKRLISIASRRSRSLSILCFTLGIGFLLSLPFLAKDGYTDERALLIGLAGVSLRPGTKYLPSTSFSPTPAPIISRKYKNYINNNQLSPLSLAHFLSQFLPQSSPLLYQLPPSSNSSSSCQLAHNVIRASKGDGSEGIVFLFILDPTTPMAASSAGLSLLTHLPTLPWLSKDVAIVFASQCKDSITAATTWLDAYNNPLMYPDMPRAGQLQQAIVIESCSGGEGGHSTIDVRVLGSNGRLPNYDLVRVLTTIATQYHRHLPITTNGIGGRKHQSSSSVATSYSILLQSMLRFMYKSVVGSSNGGHSAFIDQTIDAGTVVFVDGTDGTTDGTAISHNSQHILEYLEMVVRTSSNMHERFHHSTNMYIPFGSFKFAPVSLYIAGPGLFLGSLTFLLSHQVNSNSNSSRTGDVDGNIVVSGVFLAVACYLLFSNWCQCVLLLVLGVPILGVVGSWKKEER